MSKGFWSSLCAAWLLAIGAAAVAASRPPRRGTLVVRIVDASGQPTPARVNVIGSDSAYYQPAAAENPLAEFSLNRLGNRPDYGPIRYLGSFFYSSGQFHLELPPGPARIEVQKGYANYPVVAEAAIVAGKETTVRIVIRPAVDMVRHGWVSLDTHIHWDRPGKGAPPLVDLLSAEGIRFGHSHSANDNSRYSPIADDQLVTHQLEGFGLKSLRRRADAQMISGHEYRSGPLGHVLQIMIEGLVPAHGKDTDTRKGPALATIYDQTRAVSGVMGHAHGGNKKEILSDVVLHKSDWVELLQFGMYRGIDLEGYYLTLNSGFRYPLAGASDYPFCRWLGDSLSYVRGSVDSTFGTTTKALVRGEGFATSGPLLFLSVDGKGPGSQIEIAASAPRVLKVEAKAISSEIPMTELEIVQDGDVVARFKAATPDSLVLEGRTELRVTKSSWIAARCHASKDARAHTNPVWIYADGKVMRQEAAVTMLKKRIDAFRPDVSPETEKVLASARDRIKEIASGAEHRPLPIPSYPFDGPAAADKGGTTLLPPALPRPREPAPVTVRGSVVSESGAPVVGARVSARGQKPSTLTGRDGGFVLPGVPVGSALWLRVGKEGHITTNSAYINPRTPPSLLKIVILESARARTLLERWLATRTEAAPASIQGRPLLLANVVGPKEALSPALTARVSQRSAHFGYVDPEAAFTKNGTTSHPGGGIQIVGSVDINLVERVDSDGTEELNVIFSFEALGKDVVMPVFAGEATYVRVIDDRPAEIGR